MKVSHETVLGLRIKKLFFVSPTYKKTLNWRNEEHDTKSKDARIEDSWAYKSNRKKEIFWMIIRLVVAYDPLWEAF